MFYQVLIIACVSVIGLSATPTTTKKNCQNSIGDDEKRVEVFQDKCYYFAFDYAKTFEDAEKFCKAYGGNLAMVKSKEVNSFLQSYLTQFYSANNWMTWLNAYWIGLKYQEELGGYYWVDGTPLEFNQFQYQTIGECVVMDAKNGQWNEALCENKKQSEEEIEDDDDSDEDVMQARGVAAERKRFGYICEI